MSPSRRLALAAGVLFLISDVFAVVAAMLYGPAQNNPRYMTGSGSDTQVLLGALFEVIVALAVAGTSVALFPVVKKQNEAIALCARTFFALARDGTGHLSKGWAHAL